MRAKMPRSRGGSGSRIINSSAEDRSNLHLHPEFWPQGDQRFCGDFLAWVESELPFSGDRRDQQDALGPGEAFADAAAGAAAEGEVNILLAGFFDRLRFPSLRHEFVG